MLLDYYFHPVLRINLNRQMERIARPSHGWGSAFE